MKELVEKMVEVLDALKADLAKEGNKAAAARARKATLTLKSSPCCNSFTSISLPRKVYLLPALLEDPNSNNSSMGKFLSSSTRRNSCPTAPLAPTIATFISLIK